MTEHKLGNPAAAKKSLGEALQLSAQFEGAEEAKQVLTELEG